MKANVFVSILIAILGSACTQGPDEEVWKQLEYPAIVVPTVRCFEEERKIVIEWPKDDVCDEYLLYKDELPTGGFDDCIYRGTGLLFVDEDVKTLDTICSYYKLAKRMGKKEFSKSPYSCGVAGNFIRDSFEYNDERDAAAKLLKSSVANIYHYRDNWGNEIEDIDWYRVTLDGEYFVQIQFKDFKNYKNGLLRYALEGDTYTPVDEDENFTIYNHSSETKTFYFQVFCDDNGFGNRMVNYTIIIVRIEKF
jgi:hypothetical protein